MEKIKQTKQILRNFIESEKGKDILTVMIVVLVGLGSFGLGRLSKNNDSRGIKIEYPSESANALSGIDNAQNTANYASNNTINDQKGTNNQVYNNTSHKSFFASKKGKKYYSIGCSAGKTIKQENRIYFSTSNEAEQAGYTLSASCN